MSCNKFTTLLVRSVWLLVTLLRLWLTVTAPSSSISTSLTCIRWRPSDPQSRSLREVEKLEGRVSSGSSSSVRSVNSVSNLHGPWVLVGVKGSPSQSSDPWELLGDSCWDRSSLMRSTEEESDPSSRSSRMVVSETVLSAKALESLRKISGAEQLVLLSFKDIMLNNLCGNKLSFHYFASTSS